MSSAIQKVGVNTNPDITEKLRVYAAIALSGILTCTAACNPNQTVARNIQSLLMLGASAGLSAYAVLDSIKPDKDKEARNAIAMVKHEADIIVSEATEYYARMYPAKFLNGELPSDAFIEAFARNLIEQEGDLLALAPSKTQEFNPSFSLGESEFSEVSVSEGLSNPDATHYEYDYAQPPIKHESVYHLFEDTNPQVDDHWIESLINPSILLLFGSDGSGKTSFALELIRRRQAVGHTCLALDPHARPNKWPGCKVVGSGLEHSKIEAQISRLETIVKDRYRQISTGECNECEFPPITIVCEELTNWSSKVGNSSSLIVNAGEYRKVNVHLLLVAHGDKLGQIGSPKGFANVAANVLTKLQLFSKPGATGQPVPAMKGVLTRPLSEPISVQIPVLKTIDPSLNDVNLSVNSTNFDVNPTFETNSSYNETISLFDSPSADDHDQCLQITPKRFEHPTLGFSYTEPPILKFLESRPDLKTIVKLVVRADGTLDARTIRQRANSNKSLQDSNGTPLSTDAICNCFSELAKFYPSSFDLHNGGSSLTVKDPVLFSLVNA